MAKWNEENTDLDMRFDRTINEYKKDWDISKFIDEMETNMALMKSLHKAGKISKNAVREYKTRYENILYADETMEGFWGQ